MTQLEAFQDKTIIIPTAYCPDLSKSKNIISGDESWDWWDDGTLLDFIEEELKDALEVKRTPLFLLGTRLSLKENSFQWHGYLFPLPQLPFEEVSLWPLGQQSWKLDRGNEICFKYIMQSSSHIPDKKQIFVQESVISEYKSELSKGCVLAPLSLVKKIRNGDEISLKIACLDSVSVGSRVQFAIGKSYLSGEIVSASSMFKKSIGQFISGECGSIVIKADRESALPYGAVFPFEKCNQPFQAAGIASISSTYKKSEPIKNKIIIPSYSEKTITWLHISDLHLSVKKGAKKWDQDKITDAFLDDISELLSIW